MASTTKRRKPRFRFSMILFIILMCFALFFLIYMVSVNRPDYNPVIEADDSTSSLIDNTNTDQTTTEVTNITEDTKLTSTTAFQQAIPTIANPIPENSIPQTEDYFNSCVFIGDSITVGLASYGLIPEENVMASIGMNIEKISTDPVDTIYGNMKVTDALIQAQPQNIYIMLGSNGIAWLSDDVMIEKYSALIDEVKTTVPASAIYIMSIPPVTAGREVAEKNAILNSEIETYNAALLELANTKDIAFVDLNSALKGADGKLPNDDAAKDGMHFQKKTYQIVLDYIRSHTVTSVIDTINTGESSSNASEQAVTTLLQ